MKHSIKALLVICLSVYLTGCGSMLTAQQAAPEISVKNTSNPLVIAVLDQRPYVLEQKKKPSFEGLIRSNFGIPYSYSTPTREPMSDYLGQRIKLGFSASGIPVELQPTSLETTEKGLLALLEEKAKRSVIISLYEWKYDHHTFAKASFYDVDILVIDKGGNTIVRKKFADKEGIPSGAIYNAMQQAYKARFENFFADEEILAALEK